MHFDVLENKKFHTSSLGVTRVSRTVAQTTAPTIDQRIAIISRGTSEETCSEKLVFSAVMMQSHIWHEWV